MMELGQLLLGLSVSYLVVSVTESLSHRYLLHATPRQGKKWRNSGSIGKYIYSSWFSHYGVHHRLTFKRSHVMMFESTEQKNKLDKILESSGNTQIVIDSYGLRIGGAVRKIQYLYTHIIQLFIIGFTFGFWGFVGAFIVTVFYIICAEYIHPYLHLPYHDALDQASMPMRIVLRTNYYKYLAQHRYLHHKYINCNYNLVLGGDYLLGVNQVPGHDDVNEIERLGLLSSA